MKNKKENLIKDYQGEPIIKKDDNENILSTDVIDTNNLSCVLSSSVTLNNMSYSLKWIDSTINNPNHGDVLYDTNYNTIKVYDSVNKSYVDLISSSGDYYSYNLIQNNNNNTIIFKINNKNVIEISENKITFTNEYNEKIEISNQEELLYSLKYFLNQNIGDLKSFYKSEKERLLKELYNDLGISEERFLKMKNLIK